MRQTWRWFGPRDQASVDDMIQAGVEGVVTALHHVPTGEVWTLQEIARRQADIATMKDGTPSGLKWEVAESLPVSEDIKKQKGSWREHCETYRTSLRNLATSGVKTVCYNFMPLLDWTRTELNWPVAHGGTAMRFDLIDFAMFDIHILKRAGAAEAFPEDIAEAAAKRIRDTGQARQDQLAGNIVAGLPGTNETLSLEDVRTHIAEYDGVGPDRLRTNFIDFLTEVVPVAEEVGIAMCCHPDDPPFPLLGLPRVNSTEADFTALMAAVDSPASGITFCSGSLGARPDNDLPAMMDRLGSRVHFLHLRNVARDHEAVPTSFYESEHLTGNVDMVALVAAVLREEKRRRAEGREDCQIPMRPDHGQNIIDDIGRDTQPGYPTIGRLKGLAELRGVMAGLAFEGAA
ncbi:Mannonate dehydratase [hydrothermal vent metagenome]|uniref:mannonate dehydratase n=1 Tax=hydrothermal vent metagenome TaxID=652676 RepID=A0A3B0TU95_9ZZZZ